LLLELTPALALQDYHTLEYGEKPSSAEKDVDSCQQSGALLGYCHVTISNRVAVIQQW